MTIILLCSSAIWHIIAVRSRPRGWIHHLVSVPREIRCFYVLPQIESFFFLKKFLLRKYHANGIMVIAEIARAELVPVMLILNTILSAKMARVTMVIDMPTERANLSGRFICRLLNNTSVQANPGRKNIIVPAMITLAAGTLLSSWIIWPAMSSIMSYLICPPC